MGWWPDPEPEPGVERACETDGVFDSEGLSRNFYAQLGAEGLSARTRAEWDQKIVAQLTEMIPRAAGVLDLGCGYGRIAIPLALAGYEVHGIDLSPDMIQAAYAAAEEHGIQLPLAIGSMVDLPYASKSFDVVICLWSTFHELLGEPEQVQALREISRVLRPAGFALIEGPVYESPSADEIESGARRGPQYRVAWQMVGGLLSPHYQHDERSFTRICTAAGLRGVDVFEREWGGRQRLLAQIHNSTPPASRRDRGSGESPIVT